MTSCPQGQNTVCSGLRTMSGQGCLGVEVKGPGHTAAGPEETGRWWGMNGRDAPTPRQNERSSGSSKWELGWQKPVAWWGLNQVTVGLSFLMAAAQEGNGDEAHLWSGQHSGPGGRSPSVQMEHLASFWIQWLPGRTIAWTEVSHW